MGQRKLDKSEGAPENKKRLDRLTPDDVYIRQVADDYYNQNASLPVSLLSVRRELEYITNAFGNKRIKDITKTDVRELISGLESRGADDSYSVAEACLARGAALWNWIDSQDYGDFKNYFTSMDDLKKKYYKAAAKRKFKKNMSNNHAKEMAEVHFHKFGDGAQRAIILQAYTAVRPSSATSTTPEKTGGRRLAIDWDEFDLDAGTWLIPQRRMKGRMRSHEIIMPKQLLAHVKAWHKEDGFPEAGLVVRTVKGADKISRMIVPTVLAATYRTAGLPYTPHKWRHLISTYIAERGGAEIADLILAHYTTNAYFSATRDDDRAKWLQVWADHLDTLGFDKLVPSLIQ